MSDSDVGQCGDGQCGDGQCSAVTDSAVTDSAVVYREVVVVVALATIASHLCPPHTVPWVHRVPPVPAPRLYSTASTVAGSVRQHLTGLKGSHSPRVRVPAVCR